MTANAALAALVDLERNVVEGRKSEWRRCATFVRVEDGAARGRADAARGERLFLTHFSGGLAVTEIAPGIASCAPIDVEGHHRYPTLSGCGDVVGDGHAEDCACERAEMAYKAAYNRAVLAAHPDARARNCRS
ncbi:hypothetical protein [Sphingomonas sp. RS2018]